MRVFIFFSSLTCLCFLILLLAYQVISTIH
jgi:hypothetical protein